MRGVLSAVLAAAVAPAAASAAVRADSGATPAFTLEEITATRTLGHFDLSPSGRQAAFVLAGFYFGFPVVPRFGEDNNVRVVSLESGEITQVTTGAAPKTHPRFSPDGGRVLFESEGDLFVAVVATGATHRVTTHGSGDSDGSWSPDGRRVVFVSERGGRTDLWIASAEGERHGLDRLTDDPGREEDPQWSPDGRWVAFTARREGEHYYARGIHRVPATGGAVE
ncbi:MAG TPA: DPP IV N-terminal domain-containing protein, partial [Vicinamibacteria bacterium]|nr:DPP IV N-terminal domain-containing protein [Vicinamibacteria bacterium]